MGIKSNLPASAYYNFFGETHMSSMLEQAIIDATALKEAALKNAEAEIVEKYAKKKDAD